MESPVRIYLSAALVIHLVLLSSSNVQSSAIPPSTPQESRATSTNVTPYTKSNIATRRRLNDVIRKTTVSYDEENNRELADGTAKIRGTVRFAKSTTSSPRRRTTTKKGDITIVTPEPKTKRIPEILQSMKKYKHSVSSTPDTYSNYGNADNDHENEHESEFFKFHSLNDHHSTDDFGESGFYSNFKSPFSDSSSSPSNLKSKSKNSVDNSFGSNFDDIILTTPKNDFFDSRFTEISQSIAENIDRHKISIFKPENNHAKRIEDVSVTKSLNVNDFVNNNKKPSNNSQLYFHKSKSILVSDNDADGTSLSDVQGTSIYFEQSMLSTESYSGNNDSEGDCDDESDKTTTPTPSKITVPRVTTQRTSYDVRHTIKDLRNKKIKAAPKPTTPSIQKEVSSVLKLNRTINPARQVVHRRLVAKPGSKPVQKIENNEPKKSEANITANDIHETSSKNSTEPLEIDTRRKQLTRFNFVTSTSIIESTVSNLSYKSPKRFQSQRQKSNFTKTKEQSSSSVPSVIKLTTEGLETTTTAVVEDNDQIALKTEVTTETTLQEQNINPTTYSTNLITDNFPIYNANNKTSRRIQFTTPKSRVTHRMWVKKNNTDYTQRPRNPPNELTEQIKDERQELPEIKSTLLTTVSSDIDPVFEPEISGAKKIVHSHTVTDNSIPGLRKRGSAKYAGLSTSLPLAFDGGTGNLGSSVDLALPTASSSWGALAGMINPPTLASSNTNITAVKNPDENELQRVLDSTTSEKTSGAPTTINERRRNASAEVVTQSSSNQGWKPLYVSLVRNSSKPASSTTVKEATARPLESPPTTKILLTNELTEDSKVGSTTNTVSEDTSSGWVAANNSSNNNSVDKNNSVDSDGTTLVTQSVISSSPKQNDTTITFSVSSSVTSSQESSSQSSNVSETMNVSTPQTTTPKKDGTEKVSSNNNVVDVVGNLNLDSTAGSTETIEASFIPTISNSISSQSDLESPGTATKATEFVAVTTPTNWHSATDSKTNDPEPTLITKGSAPSVTTAIPEEIRTEESTTITKLVEFTPSYTADNTPVTTYRPVYPGNVETTVAYKNSESISSSATVTAEENNDKSTSNTDSGANDIDTLNPSDPSTDIYEMTGPIEEDNNETTPTNDATTQSIEYTTITAEGTQETTTETVLVDNASTVEKEETTQVTETVTTQRVPTETTQKVDTTVNPEITNEPVETARPEQSTETLEISTQEDLTTEAGGVPRTESKLEDLTNNFAEDLTTHSPNSGNLNIVESSSAAGVAVAVSTIGVVALLLLIGLLLVLRRRRLRGRRCGVSTPRSKPGPLDTYSMGSVSERRKDARTRASKRSYGNPAYDDEVVISHPMQYPALASFALNSESIAAEFAEIPSVSVRADEVPPGCEDKNRFSNILPLPETRVPLNKIEGDATSEYINANYVNGPGNIKNYYIACQAPLPNTVDDFWRMMWEQNSRLIVMLTEYMENGAERCYEYLPPSEVTDNKRTFGDYQIVLKRREQYDKYAISYIQVKNLVTKTWREVAHLWYFWPAKGVPDDYESVINFMCEMRSHMKIAQNAKEFDEDDAVIVENGTAEGSPGSGRDVRVYSPQRAYQEHMKAQNGTNTLARIKAAAEQDGKGVRPCVVMCASGAGRTGAVIALDLCARALESSATVDVPRTVRALRAARPHAVQNKNQYIFLYKVLSEYGHKLNGGGVDSI